MTASRWQASVPTLPTLLWVTLCVALALAPATAQEQEPRLESVELPPELQRVLTDYEDAWEAGDAAALAELFVVDGFVSGRSGWRRGHAAMRDKYANAGGDLRLRGIDFSIDGSLAYIVGAYGYGEEAAATDGGMFVLVLARTDDGSPWRIVADLDRSARRPAASD